MYTSTKVWSFKIKIDTIVLPDNAIVTIDIPFYYELNDETVKYVGTKGKITFNGEEVNIYETPSLIMSDTALISTDTKIPVFL